MLTKMGRIYANLLQIASYVATMYLVLSQPAIHDYLLYSTHTEVILEEGFGHITTLLLVWISRNIGSTPFIAFQILKVPHICSQLL